MRITAEPMLTSDMNALSQESVAMFRQAWPLKLEGRAFYLTQLQPEHIKTVWPQLKDAQSARLFAWYYGFACSNEQQLEFSVQHEVTGHTNIVSYAIFARKTSKLLGWIALRPLDMESDTLDAALFLSHDARIPLGARAFYPVCVHAFDTHHYKRIDYRWGSLGKGCSKAHPNHSGACGFSLLGILGRQLLVKEEADADYYSITQEQWQLIRPAFEAWEDTLR